MTPIELALLTWYQPDNPKYKDPLHPTIKLAGEIGELLDLYAKHLFKPGFDWMDCKYCNLQHRSSAGVYSHNYTPKVLDELGDIWYYLRILAWMCNFPFLLPDDWYHFGNLDCIKEMYRYAALGLYPGDDNEEQSLQEIYYYLNILLANLDCTIEELTELNYQKLNSEDTNHGWKDAK